MAELDARRTEVLGRSATIIQRKIRSYMGRKSFLSLRRTTICVQALWRGKLARQLYESMRREAASLIIQKNLRMHLARKVYRGTLLSAINVQSGLRGMAARNELRFRRQTKSAIIIQTQCRQYLARLHYVRIKKAAIITQCAWRGKVARRELRKLKMEAKETGALQAAKNKLEKQVEELTWRLQLEKCMRADLEEAKAQETAKLQSALQEMQLQVKETKTMLIKEREVAKKAAVQAPVIQEIPVVDTAMLDKLTSENEKLKDLVNSLEKKVDDAEKKYEETQRLSEARLKKVEEAESKIVQLKGTMKRLEEKLSIMESEDQILRQQALLNSPVKRIAEHLSIPRPKLQNLENGHHENEELKAKNPQSAPPSTKNDPESEYQLRRSHIERQHESVDALIKCVVQNIGYNQGKPVAAITVYKCLLHWKSFEAERTSVFDRLVQMFGSAIENEENVDNLAYWLSNTSSLLFLLQRSLKTGGSAGGNPQRRKPAPVSLFGRMTQSFRSSPSSANLAAGGVDIVCEVEAKYPALLFKQQLTAYVEKIYGIIRDNLKAELSKLLNLCLQAPRTARGNMMRGSGRSFGHNSPSTHWQSVIESLNTILKTLQENFVPQILIRKMFAQIFTSINVQLFNSLLLRREVCSFSNGEYIKAGLAELEIWCCQAKEEYAGSAWDELKHIRQAVGFLVIFQKSKISFDEIINDLCPVLSLQQLYRICTVYWDDKYGTQSVSPSVISSMRVLMTEDSNNAVSDAFILEDTSSIPFSIDDISNSLQEKDFADVKPASQLLENPAFQFLQE